MYANYHTHSTRCKHAVGTPREYVENAIQNGMKILGFSDHVPYPYKSGFVSGMRMAVEETGEYVSDILPLREEFKDEIQIFIGYEAEYFRKDFSAMLENICQYECDYLILGQHFTDSEPDGAYPPSSDKSIGEYTDVVIEAMNTGKFSYVAHPDIAIPAVEDANCMKHMERLCREAKKLSIPLEINVHGLNPASHHLYPRPVFWEMAKDIGNDVVIGCDAHRPDYLNNTDLQNSTYDFARKLGIEPLKTIELHKVK